MKKIICLMLSLFIVFGLAACGKSKTASDPETVDIEYFAKLGKIPECDYTVGTNVDQMLSELKNAQETESSENEEAEPDDHADYNVMEGDDTVTISYNNSNYYYRTDKKEDGISCIVNFGTAYGFPLGTVIIEIQNALKEYESEEQTGNSDKLFFLPSAEGYTYLEYSFGKYTVLFAFHESALCATLIYNTETWLL